MIHSLRLILLFASLGLAQDWPAGPTATFASMPHPTPGPDASVPSPRMSPKCSSATSVPAIPIIPKGATSGRRRSWPSRGQRAGRLQGKALPPCSGLVGQSLEGRSLGAGRIVYQDRVWAIIGGIDGPSAHLAEQVVAKARLAAGLPRQQRPHGQRGERALDVLGPARRPPAGPCLAEVLATRRPSRLRLHLGPGS